MTADRTSGQGKYRALIVDNDASIRDLALQALTAEGFVCDTAGQGLEAQALAVQNAYDVVLTDLRMPIQNGSLLVLELLQLQPRPRIVVFTGVTDPRLTKELLGCGVDDVIFKPVRFSVLAAKILALVEKFGPTRVSSGPTKQDQAPVGADSVAAPLDPHQVVPAEEYERRLYGILELPPVSPVLLDVFRMAKSESGNAEQLAANIARDAFLAAEVLRMANSAFYNPAGKQISEWRLAVARLGRRTIAALALARHMLAKTWSGWSHLINAQLAWRQSVGAGVAVEMIMEQRQQPMGDELFLCALMHSMGRLILLSLFPDTYKVLVDRTASENSTLIEEERRVFPESHSATMMRLLRHWGISPAVYSPLEFTADDFDEVRKLKEPLRSQVELVKVAALIGRIAAGPWHSWEQVEFPPEDVMSRLGVRHDALQNIIETTTGDTEKLCTLGAGGATGDRHLLLHSQLTIDHAAPYAQLSPGFDWLRHMLTACGIQPEQLAIPKAPLHATEPTKPGILNCIDHLGTLDERLVHGGLMVVVGSHDACTLKDALRLPCSFEWLRKELRRVSTPSSAGSAAIPHMDLASTPEAPVAR